MNYKKGAKKIARQFPGARQLVLRQEEQHRLIEIQAAEINELRRNLKEYEKRDELWAQEVRELRGDDKRLGIVWPAFKKDIIAADWRNPPAIKKTSKTKPPFTINWVVPPMGSVSGGNVDIFRTIGYLESKGHTCRVYFYDARNSPSFEQVKETMKEYPPINSKLFYNAKTMHPCDVIIATGWNTAYPVFNYKGTSKKFYFVQDFESYFEPVGSYSTFAENTYRFGFYGITLGEWLCKKLGSEYGMNCDYINMGTDLKEYNLTNKSGKRKKILFYARPVSPRRGFEIGSLALSLFHKQHPDYEIHCLGWDLSRYDLPFPFVNAGILNAAELNKLYNECVAGLVLSFTNMSLLPLEMLASGCIPVMNDSEHTRLVPYKDHLAYAQPNPAALAEALGKVVTDKDIKQRAVNAAEYAQKLQWDDSNAKFEKILTKELAR